MKPASFTISIITLSIMLLSASIDTAAKSSITTVSGSTNETVADTSRTNRRKTKTTVKRKKTRTTSQTGANPNDYRQAAGNGTALNNSNITNYNTQNAVANPTGTNPAPMPADNTGNGLTGGASQQPGREPAPSATAGSMAVRNAQKTVVSADPNASQPSVAGQVSALSIGGFVAASPNHTTLQNTLQAADLSQMLREEKGPFTVFAPTNAAFKNLPTDIQQHLLDGQYKAALNQLLAGHVVRGKLDPAELTRRVQAGNGSTQLQTMGGQTLTVRVGADGKTALTDAAGNILTLDMADGRQSNGVVYSLDRVLLSPNTAGVFH